MGEGIISMWRFTLGGSVLLDYGHKLVAEVQFTGSGLVTPVPLIRADQPLLRQGKNVAVQISWESYQDYESDAAARLALLNGLVSRFLAAPASLVIEISGGSSKTFEKSLLVSASPRRHMQGRFCRIITAYQLTATKPTA
jgi:hypothetical protein